MASFNEWFSQHSTTVCLFKNTTGLACPSCGTTRAMEALLHGNLLHSFQINPLGIPGFMAMAFIPFWLFFDACTRKNSLHLTWVKAEYWLRQPIVYWPAILLILVNWAWNITKQL
jgi:hypothetical protein